MKTSWMAAIFADRLIIMMMERCEHLKGLTIYGHLAVIEQARVIDHPHRQGGGGTPLWEFCARTVCNNGK